MVRKCSKDYKGIKERLKYGGGCMDMYTDTYTDTHDTVDNTQLALPRRA